jgi:hypothetical protein
MNFLPPYIIFKRIEQKRKEMDTNTPVTDEMVKEFANLRVKRALASISKTPWPNMEEVTSAEWEAFKSQHSSSGRDWEIIKVIKNGAISFFSSGRGYAMDEIDGYSIYQVKRGSDGQLFTVGDELCNLGVFSDETHKITSIQLINGTIALNYGNGGSIVIQAAKKAPIPPPKPVLLTTEEGVDKFNGDSTYFVNTDNYRMSILYNLAGNVLENFPSYLFFHSEVAAREYVFMHKPCLSVNDVTSVLTLFENLSAKVMWPNYEEKFKQLAKSKITL